MSTASNDTRELRSLRKRFLWLLGGVAALFAVGMGLSLVFSVRANEAALDGLLEVEARQAQASIVRRWDYYRQLVDNLARDPALVDTLLVGSVDDRQRWAVARQNLMPGLLGLALVGMDGQIYGDANVLRVGPSCRRDLASDTVRLTPVHRDMPGLEHVDLIGVVRGPGGDALGKLFISVRLEQLRRILEDSTQPGHAILLLDGAGRPVIGSGNSSLTGETRDIRVPLPKMGWSLLVQAPAHQLGYDSMMHIVAGMLTLAGVVTLLVVAAVRLRRPLVDEIQAALGALDRLTRDEAAPPVQARYVEFVPAMNAINRIAQQLREQREQLARLSLTDALTALPNRRAFEAQFPHMLGLADRGHPIALVLLDVDHFKQINDQLGHAAGDQALIALARTLASLTRSADMSARLAGDEFTVMLSGLDDRGIEAWYQRLADRFRSELAAVGLNIDNTLSAGQTWLQPVSGDSIAKALGRADYALYQAKERGRGRLVLGDTLKPDDAG